MADTIKIGNLDISAFKVGSDNCKIYLGDTLLYPQAVNNMFVGNYTGGNQYTIECSTSTALTSANVEAAPYAKSTLLSAEVSACGHDTFRIGSNAFSGASSMSAITIDNNVTQFGNQAFFHTDALKSITFPSKLDTIEGSCFRLSGVRRISGIPSGVTYLSSGCFADMYSLSAATIPSSVTGSSTNIFLRDSGLTEVHFERTTAPALGADAFKNCTALVKIYIPNCNCFDSYAAQSQFSGLTSIIYAEGTNTRCQPYTIKSYIKKDSSHIGNVNLGMKLPSNFKIVISVRPTSNNGGLLFGDTTTTSETNDFRFFGSGTRPYFDFESSRIYYNADSSFVTTGRTYTVTLTNYKMVLETASQSTRTVTGGTHGTYPSYNLYAFKNSSGDYAQIYYIKVYSGDTLVGDFVPILTDGGVYTMLNKVNNTICSTNGTLTGG